MNLILKLTDEQAKELAEQIIAPPQEAQEEIPSFLIPFPKLPTGFKEWKYRGVGWKQKKGNPVAFRSRRSNWILGGNEAIGGENIYYLEAIPAYKEPAKARREWGASVCRADGEIFQRDDNDNPKRWEHINVREVLPGDPTQDDIDELVSAATSIVAGATDTRWLETALQPFTGKKSS